MGELQDENPLTKKNIKMELFRGHGSRYIWHKANAAEEHDGSTEHCGGSVMVWDSFDSRGPGRLVIFDGAMNSALY